VKRIVLAILAGVSCAASAAEAPSPNSPLFRLCVLDQAALVQHSRLARASGEQFQKIRRQAQEKLEEDTRTLEADTRALEGLPASIPLAVARMRDAEIEQRRAVLKDRIAQTNSNLTALDKELTKNVLEAAAQVIRTVEAERSCSMSIARSEILNLRDMSLDITPFVIDRINTAPEQQATPQRR
jgi:Skp family chaperone for outer membrane proteins